MKTLKLIARLIAGLSAGIVIGLVIGGLCAVLFTDTTFPEFVDKFRSLSAAQALAPLLAGIVGFAVSIPLLVLIHEGGHLVCGLLSGYRFVSFRVFNLTFIRENGKLHVKRFSIAGTGGQCLLCPPDLPLEKIPTAWYNAGGVLANLLVLLLVLPLYFFDISPLLTAFLSIFVFTDLFLLVTNGIPMTIGGLGNDAYNALMLRKNLQSKRGLMIQLRSNALIQSGVRPKDMPAEWFESEGPVDYANALEAAVPMMYASRLVDEEKWDDAYNCFAELYTHKEDIMPLYVNEIACELAFCALVTGRIEQAGELLDDSLMKYIESCRKSMSSKERLLCAVELYLKGNSDGAMAIYTALEAESDKFLLQGEVKSDLAQMRRMLGVTS